MKPPLTLRIAGVVAVVVACLAAIVDQGDKFVSAQEIVGLHEFPWFVPDRVELTPALVGDRPAEDAGAFTSDRMLPADLMAGKRVGRG